MPPQSTKKVDAGRIPGPAAVPGCIAVKMHYTLPNQKLATCELHGRNSGSFVPSVTSANALHGSLSGSMNTRLVSFLAAGFIFSGVSVRDMTDPTFPEFLSTSAAVPIGNVANALPADVSAVLTERANTRGRGALGRIYLPGFGTTADTGAGVISTACQTALNGLGTDWLANMLASSLVVAIAKPARQEYLGTSGALHPQRAASTVDVLSLTCQNTEWDTQRRRGR